MRISHGKLAAWGTNLASRFPLSADDVCYSAMPLFHSNAVLVGWAVAQSSADPLIEGFRMVEVASVSTESEHPAPRRAQAIRIVIAIFFMGKAVFRFVICNLPGIWFLGLGISAQRSG